MIALYPIPDQKGSNHTLWHRTYLYSLYKGVPPPPQRGIDPLCNVNAGTNCSRPLAFATPALCSADSPLLNFLLSSAVERPRPQPHLLCKQNRISPLKRTCLIHKSVKTSRKLTIKHQCKFLLIRILFESSLKFSGYPYNLNLHTEKMP